MPFWSKNERSVNELIRNIKQQTWDNDEDRHIIKSYQHFRPVHTSETICYAPFKSLYFGHGGKAVACCYNRNYVLGNYPDQSIKEIWEGERINALRKKVRNFDFGLGCDTCEMQFKAENFDAFKARQYDHNRLNKNNLPSVFEFELNNTCNLECIMCNGEFSSSIRKNREKKSALSNPYDIHFVKQLEYFIPYLQMMKFYGGEPFLIDIYYDIWERTLDLNSDIQMQIQTNATILNERVMHLLEKGRFQINISLDSLERENFEKIRQNASYDRVMTNIDFFRAYALRKKVFFGISTCAMRQNWEELPSFVTHCNKENIQLYFHTVNYPSDCSLWNLDPEELEHIMDYYNSYDFETRTGIQRKNKQHFEHLKNQIRAWIQEGYGAKQQKTALSYDSFEELKYLIHSHIQKTDPDHFSARMEGITAKLNVLKSKMEEMKTDHLNVKDFQVDISNIVTAFEMNDVDEIVNRVLYKINMQS